MACRQWVPPLQERFLLVSPRHLVSPPRLALRHLLWVQCRAASWLVMHLLPASQLLPPQLLSRWGAQLLHMPKMRMWCCRVMQPLLQTAGRQAIQLHLDMFCSSCLFSACASGMPDTQMPTKSACFRGTLFSLIESQLNSRSIRCKNQEIECIAHEV